MPRKFRAVFSYRVATGTFGAWRVGQHDLVLAVALAAWVGERCLTEGRVGVPKVLGGPGG